MIETFELEPAMRFLILMALEIAHLPASTAFFAQVLREGDPRYIPYCKRALRAIDTSESRKILWEHSAHDTDQP